MERKTIFSDDRVYRYTLWREFEQPAHLIAEYSPATMRDGYVQFIGLNPSTADETKDDPTIRRCIGFAKAWGYAALCMTNLFAFRATDPYVMKSHQHPVGDDNTHHLLTCGANAGLVVAAWGKHGTFRHQDLNVRQILYRAGVRLHCLGLNSDGTPKHPLYLKKDTTPSLFS